MSLMERVTEAQRYARMVSGWGLSCYNGEWVGHNAIRSGMYDTHASLYLNGPINTVINYKIFVMKHGI